MSLSFVRRLDQLNMGSISIAGGKASSLGELITNGYKVPKGYVILAQGFTYFIKKNNLKGKISQLEKNIDITQLSTIDETSKKICKIILDAVFPEELICEILSEHKKLGAKIVAVRSSAICEDSKTTAWAGLFKSYLNTKQDELILNIKKCWASLYSKEVISYKHRNNLQYENSSIAVIIQEMINGDVSGTGFSVHPVSCNHNHILIESALGMGEAIVSGEIIPHSYVIDKYRKRIISKNIQDYNLKSEFKERIFSNKDILTHTEINKLVNVLIKLENHFNYPVDIEWTKKGNRTYLLQCRPITTLNSESIITSNKITLSKTFTRQRSLFYCSVWSISNTIEMKRLLGFNFKNLLFIINNQNSKITVWYDERELKKMYRRITDLINNNSNFFSFILSEFYRLKKPLEPYIEEGKKIETIPEFLFFHDSWIKWWVPMAIIFVIVDLEGIPKRITQKALVARSKTHIYNEEGNKVFLEYIKNYQPHLDSIKKVLLPKELDIIVNNKMEFNIINEIKSRITGFGLLNNNVYLNTELINELKVRKIELENINVDINDSIRGTVASTGKVIGIVRLVLVKEEIFQLKEGEILVTEMTSPDLVLSMKNAAAIITDEGGMTSHAAITSRELGIPCIVGTKIATSILKTGDKILVDAINGIIRII